MEIFQAEIDDGIAETIKSSASISYASAVEQCSNKNLLNSKIKNIKSMASISDSDLYYVQSILVSSSWNKNDDIFDKKEVWAARNTPEDKPTNLEHDENIIIGHITSNWPITEDGILIDEDTPTENLPEKYHMLTGSVMYRGCSNSELKERSDKLRAGIENGQKYVSMECYFNGFDYGIINKNTGEYKVLARDNNTAYLTKYLRAYGGVGEHEDYKIGRVLRNITFSGKGYVDKPANPDSIIFTKDSALVSVLNNPIEKNTDLSIAGVSNNQSILNAEKQIMSLDLEPVLKEVAELQARVEAMQGCSEIVKEAYAAAANLKDKTLELETTIKAHEETIASLQSALDTANTEKEEAAKKMTEETMKKEEEMKRVKSELDEAHESLAAYKNKEEEMAKKEKKMKRMAALLEVGIDNDTATATVDKFENLDDDAFEAMTSLFAGKMPPWLNKENEKDPEEDKMKTKKKASEDAVVEADPSVLETAEVDASEVSLSVGGDEESALEATRAALVEFVESRLNKKL